MTECSVCHLRYCADDLDDALEHAEHCANFQTAAKQLEYTPAHSAAQETTKAEGWALVNAAYADIRLKGAEMVLRSHFDRSLRAAINGDYWREHPSFPDYVAAACVERLFDAELAAEFRTRYGHRPGEMAPGYSYWHPEGPHRTQQFMQAAKDTQVASR